MKSMTSLLSLYFFLYMYGDYFSAMFISQFAQTCVKMLCDVLGYQVETNKVFLRDTTIISPYSILLFGGSMSIQHQVSFLSTPNVVLV